MTCPPRSSAQSHISGGQRSPAAAADTSTTTRPRSGGGPTFLEVLTYRYLEHVGPYPDVDLGYRDQHEIDSWRRRDRMAVNMRPERRPAARHPSPSKPTSSQARISSRSSAKVPELS